MVGEISHFEFESYRVILTGLSDLKLFVDGVYILIYILRNIDINTYISSVV